MKSESKMMSESKIRQALAESSQHTVRGMTRYMKNHYSGKYDVELARKNAKELVADIPRY